MAIATTFNELWTTLRYGGPLFWATWLSMATMAIATVRVLVGLP